MHVNLKHSLLSSSCYVSYRFVGPVIRKTFSFIVICTLLTLNKYLQKEQGIRTYIYTYTVAYFVYACGHMDCSLCSRVKVLVFLEVTTKQTNLIQFDYYSVDCKSISGLSSISFRTFTYLHTN